MSSNCLTRSDEEAEADEFEFVNEAKADPRKQGRELRVLDLPQSGVITHQTLDDIRAAAMDKLAVAQFISSRSPKKPLAETLRERRLTALKRVEAKRGSGRCVSRPHLVVPRVE